MSGPCWRSVEAQHRVSTMKLVDTLEEQRLLETLIDESKPPLPPDCQHLHYLLATPFRYGAPYPSGSRFRRAGLTAGVFYASNSPITAMTEMAFHRLLFFADSPSTPWPANAGEYTVFSVRFRTAAGLDLTRPPLAIDADRWTHLTDYRDCQALADARGRREPDPLRVGARRAWRQLRAPLVPGVRGASTRRSPDVAARSRIMGRAWAVRFSCGAPGIGPRGLRRRPPHRTSRLGPMKAHNHNRRRATKPLG
jgi:hypothetical protein